MTHAILKDLIRGGISAGLLPLVPFSGKLMRG